MKKKLKIVFILIAIALFGIIIFQAYWTINAYRVNKEKFDANINIAMQNAMDDCKKDYIDSIRIVLVKRLSPPETTIKVDTLHEKDTINVQLKIRLSNVYTSMITPISVTTPVLEFYRKKINHKATLPEVLTEWSLYVPRLVNQFTMILGMYDIAGHSAQLDSLSKKYHRDVPPELSRKFTTDIPNSIYAFPPNYRKADSLKLNNYLKTELSKLHINSRFKLSIATNSTPADSGGHNSKTTAFSYKYHGFKLFDIVGPEFFIRAVFFNPQYAVLKSMLFTLILSVLLVLFTIFSFYYIIKTFMEQKKLADLKDEFINNMTHELKTPIATITVAIEGLQKFNALNDAEKTARYIQTSRNELSRLNNLVTKVLDIAAFENKEVNLQKEQINLDSLINEVIESEKLKTPKQVNITFTNTDHIQSIYADKTHISNVLTNLIDNAIKYAGEAITVAISCNRDGSDAVIAVKDNGIGIAPADIALIFDKFYRVPTGNVHNVKGTGLGLSYVKYIVEAHGGKISVKSELNSGSVFIISIPLGNG